MDNINSRHLMNNYLNRITLKSSQNRILYTNIFYKSDVDQNSSWILWWLFLSHAFCAPCINPLVPARLKWNSRSATFKLILILDGWGDIRKIALRWLSLNLTDDKLMLVQVMAWCHQAPSHYLSQCWPRSMWPYDTSRPQWVNMTLCCNYYIIIYLFILVHAVPTCLWRARW